MALIYGVLADECLLDAIKDTILDAEYNRVLIALNYSPQSGDFITYGRGRPGDPASCGPQDGPRGNLRDQAGDLDNYVDGAGTVRYMHNWCVMFEDVFYPS
jgi:hypothetical protein